MTHYILVFSSRDFLANCTNCDAFLIGTYMLLSELLFGQLMSLLTWTLKVFIEFFVFLSLFYVVLLLSFNSKRSC